MTTDKWSQMECAMQASHHSTMYCPFFQRTTQWLPLCWWTGQFALQLPCFPLVSCKRCNWRYDQNSTSVAFSINFSRLFWCWGTSKCRGQAYHRYTWMDEVQHYLSKYLKNYCTFAFLYGVMHYTKNVDWHQFYHRRRLPTISCPTAAFTSLDVYLSSSGPIASAFTFWCLATCFHASKKCQKQAFYRFSMPFPTLNGARVYVSRPFQGVRRSTSRSHCDCKIFIGGITWCHDRLKQWGFISLDLQRLQFLELPEDAVHF